MKNTILICLFTLLVIASCQPENSFKREDVQTTVEDFYKENRAAVQTTKVPVLSGGSMTTAAGMKIYFPANGFVSKDGSSVTGDVSVTVKELITPYDMIINNMPTMADGVPLQSGGEFKIDVSKDNKELVLAPGMRLRIQMPRASQSDMAGMQVFKGSEDAQGNVNWTLNTAPGNVVVGDSVLFAGSSLFSSSTGWINCDKFYNEPTVSYTVHPVNAPSNDSTNVFVHLTGKNSVVKMNWTRGLPYFQSDMLLAVPSTFIGISVKNGRFYASLVPANVQDGGSVTLNFTPYTEKQLKQKLSELH